MQGLSLRKNFAWAFVGNVVASGCMWLLLMILTKLAPVETVGLFAVAQAVGLPISVLLSLRLYVVQVTDAKNDFNFGHYCALRIITSVIMVVVIGAAGFIFYPVNTAWVILVLGVGYAIVAFREVFLAQMQKVERLDKMSISRMLQGIFSLIMFAGFYWVSKSLIWAILGIIIARIGVLCFFDIPVTKLLFNHANGQRKIAAHWHKDMLWRLVRLTAPLGLVAWFGSLFTSTPRLVMDKFVGREEVGYFAAMSSLLVVGNKITGALGDAILPRLAKYYAANRRAYKLLLLKLTALSLFVGIAGVVVSALFGKMILTLVFTAAYGQHADILVQIMIAGGALLLFSCMNAGLTAARKFAVQVPVYGIAAGVCAVSAFLLIPRYGMAGAAWALLICYCTGFAGCFFFLMLAMRKIESGQQD